MRLYRKGLPEGVESSWFPTILESINYPGNDKNVMTIMWISTRNFHNHFENSGIGYKAKNKEAYIKARPVIQSLTIEEFQERLEDPVLSRLYTDEK